jgi:hypothetical protein
MAGKRSDSSVPPSSGHEGGNEPQKSELERCGPVAIARHVKDDGRALILYTHTREPQR